MKILTIFLYALAILCASQAKIFKRCEVVHKLEKHGVPDWQIPTFTCLAKWESKYDSEKLDYKTGRHGIFQISEKVWCSPVDYPGLLCETTCDNFRDNSLGDDIKCALKMYQESKTVTGVGYAAWDSYWPYCASGDNMEYIRYCY